jgi:hypothetical protein
VTLLVAGTGRHRKLAQRLHDSCEAAHAATALWSVSKTTKRDGSRSLYPGERGWVPGSPGTHPTVVSHAQIGPTAA